ncbi:3-keto-5-aminohexanoate cleavage protein [Rhodococcus tukisamuensis]|uniref:Uncharacterized conserved protein, DUF849 family n=1 Tax=Rhodococcus tukisamuensis TaxID=168276 RepID=A0A1G6T6A2_9NOCA|nr:3-keto-5-aminohexanoate cleavage protein [Rhodococcus tukisamuensis]SDD24394.1 Uncharacterized conserved protein, DUF849 family [Rhodococcus tukisamuensis]
MYFQDDSLFPDCQEKLVITAAPYGSEWELEGVRDDLPMTIDEHVQAAVDCYEAGASVLHIRVREDDGTNSKRLSRFNELLSRLREAVPDMILQVGGSISFVPEGDGADAKSLADDPQHLIATLDPKPDQVTVTVSTKQMNVTDMMSPEEIAGTSLERPEVWEAYRERVVAAGPRWVEEHLRRLQAAGIQPQFQVPGMQHLEKIERLIRTGTYTGPLVLTWVGIGGGGEGPNPYNVMKFIQRVPDGAVITLESLMRSVLPINNIAMTLGLHARCGNEGNLWGHRGERMTSAEQVRQLVRIATELGREVANGKEAREIYKLDERYAGVDETLARIGYSPNRRPGEFGFTQRA